jgi:flagellar hook-associated protein 2
MFSSISNLIGGSSGVNSAELVADLLRASRAPREAVLRQREQLNQAQISALASASSSLDVLASALQGLLDGRRFAGELLSSAPTIASVSRIDRTVPQGLPASLEVVSLASAQRLVSAPLSSPANTLGGGTMTLTTVSGAFDITLTPGSDTLRELAAAINAAQTGVTASLLSDNAGTRLVLEGAEGADQSFTVAGDFAPFNLPSDGSSMALVASAADAHIRLDNIDLTFSGNKIDGAIPGVSVDLISAAPGNVITISGNQPVTALRDLVTEFVDAYNILRKALNTATAPGQEGINGGPLAGNSAVRNMMQSLSRISSTALTDTGPYRRLSDIGVRTASDGTLSVNAAMLDAALAADPDAVTAMLDPAQPDVANPGIAGVVQAVRDRLQDQQGPLVQSKLRLENARSQIANLRERLDSDMERTEALLQRSFANMDRQLAVLRATQSYISQQVDAWNSQE